jgi:MoaA/NifB/PqqE/SkfB family radical SAM enzyme
VDPSETGLTATRRSPGCDDIRSRFQGEPRRMPGSILTDLQGGLRKATEIDTVQALLHPGVVANYLLHIRERRARPVVMKSHPIGIEIELTNRCNLACVQCLRSQGLRPYEMGRMNLETYKRVLEQFPYTVNLSLSGFGEALLHEEFFDIVRFSRARLPWAKVGIYSNGMLLDEATAAEVVACGLSELNVSIDAAQPETYRRVRRGGDLPTVHANIRRLIRARRRVGAKRPLVGVNFVMLDENEGELVRFVEQAAEMEVDFVNCISYATNDWGHANHRTPESYRVELDAARGRMDALGIRCKWFPEALSASDAARPFECSLFWGDEFRVTCSGHISLGCCTPFKETFSYGNVLETPFPEIWNNPAFRRNREMAKKGTPPVPACESCHRFRTHFFAERGRQPQPPG